MPNLLTVVCRLNLTNLKTVFNYASRGASPGNKIKVIMSRLRVNEAIARAQTNGKKIYKKDVSARLWDSSTESSQQVNMTNLCNGTTKKIAPEWVHIICEMTDCTPNYLFGYEE